MNIKVIVSYNHKTMVDCFIMRNEPYDKLVFSHLPFRDSDSWALSLLCVEPSVEVASAVYSVRVLCLNFGSNKLGKFNKFY